MRYLLPFALLLFALACTPDDDGGGTPEPTEGVDLTGLDYAPVAYDLVVPANFPPPPADKVAAMTEAGVDLGRHLFYDTRLSSDGSMSCASCHQQSLAFTDGRATSTGVQGENGKRSSMMLINLIYENNGVLWDGAEPTLAAQSLRPVEDPVEFFESWDNVEAKLRAEPRYHEKFRAAFGIGNSTEIDRTLVTQALEQFLHSIVSGGDSRFDKRTIGGQGVFFTDEEAAGFDLFFSGENNAAIKDAQCFHCHGGALFTTHEYFNNGLEEAQTLTEFTDKGRGLVTNSTGDNGKFRAPSLRNIALTAPYMHDGRLATLEDVVRHYNSDVQYAPNLDPNLQQPLGLTDDEVGYLVAFLNTLTDESVLTDERYGDPWE